MATSPWPVISSTGMSGSIAWMRANSARPSMPGMRTSETTAPVKSRDSALSAAGPLSKVATSKPASSSPWTTATRRASSSSTNTTCPAGAVIGRPCAGSG
jgi:hypothetical protein